MADPKKAQNVERTISEVLEGHLAQIRSELVKRLTSEAGGAAAAPSGSSATDLLYSSVASIQDAASQTDILAALLDGTAKFSGRCALFVVRGGTINGWQARGFKNRDDIKKVSLDSSQGLAGRAIHDRSPVAAAAAEFDADFIATHGNPAGGNALVLPLVVKEKVAAVIYADAGTSENGALDSSALQVLLRAASLWLEVLAVRKAGGVPAAAPERPAAEPMLAPTEKVVESVATLTAPTPAPTPAAAEEEVPAEEKEIHKKAKRFAKLLVDEIKLYNQKKVKEGREKRDLYERLKDDIEKSRATYDKRYGQTPAAKADYFNKEIVRILADNDVSLLGSSFPG